MRGKLEGADRTSVSVQIAMEDRMASTLAGSNTRRGRMARIGLELAWHLLPVAIFIIWIFRAYPYRDVFALDLDEGINLMKAMLLGRGFQLYSQIWSDQPPLFTYLLAGWFKLFGEQVNQGRLLSLLFSGMLLWGAMQFLRLVWGKIAALCGLVLIVLLPGYLQYSVSVLIGLPSLAFAFLAMLAVTIWHRRRQPTWLWLSGLLFSLSIFTKLITGFIIPILLAGLILGEKSAQGSEKRWATLRPAFTWLTAFGLASIIFAALLVGPVGIPQLVLPHLQATRLEVFRAPDATLTIQYHLRSAWPVILLASLGGLAIFLRRRWLGLYPLAWAIVAYVLLSFYTPVWAHQQLLVTVPAALVAAGGLGEGLVELPEVIVRRGPSGARALFPLVLLASACLVLLLQIPRMSKQWQSLASIAQKPTSAETTVLRKLDKFVPQTRWLVTDQPMFAFRAGLLVPPELAVLSSKRVETGNLNADQFQDAIDRYQPEQILIGRFDFPGLEEALRMNYRLTYERPDLHLYVRTDLN